MTSKIATTAAKQSDDARSADKAAQLVETAIECFARYGVHRTRVEDVADAAQISRPTFYRYFSSREELVDAVVLKQLQDIIDRFGPEIRKAKSFEGAVIEGSIKVLQACLEDQVFMELLHRARRERLSDLSLHSSTFVYPMALELWKPVLEQARERGEIRDELEDNDIIRWLASVHLLFLLRSDTTPKEIRSIMGSFVTPALVRAT